MESIIEPISKDVLISELKPELRLRSTNKAGNEIYIVTWHNAPNVVKEIGRLREIAFRAAGGGTGLACDLDEFDTCEHPYHQLIVWNPEDEEILGGYRFLPGSECEFDAKGQPKLATSHLFHFTEEFIKDYLPYTVELGRSFVSLEYQSTRALSKSIFALDNLWDGLGALTIVIPESRYFFGKMTMYPSFHRLSRDLILHFLLKHYPDLQQLVTPHLPLLPETPAEELAALLPYDDLRTDYRELKEFVRQRGVNIPPLFNAYMSLSPTMRCFGTALNRDFGNVEETGILIATDEILQEKKMRHIDTYVKEHPATLEQFLDHFVKR